MGEMSPQTTLNTPLLKRIYSVLMPGVCLLALCARADMTTNPPPTEWIDPDTGHRVIQLSREPGSQSLYFNLNAFTPDGQKMVISTPTGISAINLKTRAIEKIVDGRPASSWSVTKPARFIIAEDRDVFTRPTPTPKSRAKSPSCRRAAQYPRSMRTRRCWREPSPARTDWATNEGILGFGPQPAGDRNNRRSKAKSDD